MKTLSSHQLIEFLSLLLQEVSGSVETQVHHSPGSLTVLLLVLQNPLPLTHVKRMQEVYGLNAFTNSEIRFR